MYINPADYMSESDTWVWYVEDKNGAVSEARHETEREAIDEALHLSTAFSDVYRIYRSYAVPPVAIVVQGRVYKEATRG